MWYSGVLVFWAGAPENAVLAPAAQGRAKEKVAFSGLVQNWVTVLAGGSVKRSAPPEPGEGSAMAAFPWVGPSPGPSALTLPPSPRCRGVTMIWANLNQAPFRTPVPPPSRNLPVITGDSHPNASGERGRVPQTGFFAFGNPRSPYEEGPNPLAYAARTRSALG